LSPAFDHVVSAFDYAGLGERLVKDYKFAGRLSLARLLADCLSESVLEAPAAHLAEVDWVMPVPARPDSLRERGFSPPAEVARIVARRLRLRYRLDLVRRVGQGPRQGTLGRAARLRAPEGIYACAPGSGHVADLAGRQVVVIDDVLTTGATLHAVARALKAGGASRVQGWVLARARADSVGVLQ